MTAIKVLVVVIDLTFDMKAFNEVIEAVKAPQKRTFAAARWGQ